MEAWNKLGKLKANFTKGLILIHTKKNIVFLAFKFSFSRRKSG